MDALFFEIFESLPRQGPGDEVSTGHAFKKLTDLPEYPEILDVGCGVGKQTIALAKLTSGYITALDNHAPFIEILKRNVNEAGYSDKVTGVVGDMAAMHFADESFDLVWSEGAAYSMGFENAPNAWKRLLRPKGYLVVSELVWFKAEAPQPVKDFFAEEYPAMRHFKAIYPIIESAGYKIIDSFQLPDQSWWTDYYTPMETVIAEKKAQYGDNGKTRPIFEGLQLEAEIHRKYKEYYGYGFYIMQKAD